MGQVRTRVERIEVGASELAYTADPNGFSSDTPDDLQKPTQRS